MRYGQRKKLYDLSLQGYEKIAVDFERTRKQLFWPPLKEIVERLAPGAKLLDIGCGTGRLLSYLDQTKINYVGLDNSQEMLNIAKGKYPGVKFVLGDILALDKLDELKNDAPFDCIAAVAVWHHLPGREWQTEAIAKALTLLAPQGELVIIVQNFWRKPKYRRLLWLNFLKHFLTFHPGYYRDLIFPWLNSKREELGERYYHVFTRRELKKISHSAGARLISLTADKHNYYLVLTSKSL